MESLLRRVELLYIVTLALATVHVVDSAYWQEWEVLGLPGGIQFFLVQSLVLAVPFFVGVSKLAKGARSGPLFGIALSAAGVAGFVIHAILWVRGAPEFRTVASVATIVLMLAFSIGLMVGSVRLKRAMVAR
jgi:hypothetical protein